MIKIWVSGTSGIVGYGCAKSLKVRKDYYVIGTSIYDSLISRQVCDEFYVAPKTSNEEYIAWVLEFVCENCIDVMIPGIECDLYNWNENRHLIEKEGVKIVLNNQNLISLCEDKWKFYCKLEEKKIEERIESILTTDYSSLKKRLGEEFIVKPRRGFAARGIELIRCEDDYVEYSREHTEFFAQRYIKGEEYTIGAFFDKEANLVASIGMKRQLSKVGYTQEIEVIENGIFVDIIKKIGKILGADGVTNFQFIKDESGVFLLEVNPRISSSTSLRTAFGYNECVMAVEYAINGTVPSQPQILRGRAERYIEDVIEYDSDNI